MLEKSIVRHHVDTIRLRHTTEPTEEDMDHLPLPDIPSLDPEPEEPPTATDRISAAASAAVPTPQPPSQLRLSSRPHNPPDRYGFGISEVGTVVTIAVVMVILLMYLKH